jgi:hypothetical protein
MSRPKGAKNKPKVCMVNLSDLIANLNPDSQIPVEIKFAQGVLIAQKKEAYAPTPVTAPLAITVTETGSKPVVAVEEAPMPTVSVEEDTAAPVAIAEPVAP